MIKTTEDQHLPYKSSSSMMEKRQISKVCSNRATDMALICVFLKKESQQNLKKRKMKKN